MDFDFDGAQVKILPDVTRATIQSRVFLRPVLDRVRQTGHTYRWRFPISVMIWKGSSSFMLRSQTDLPDLFSFLNIKPLPGPELSSVTSEDDRPHRMTDAPTDGSIYT